MILVNSDYEMMISVTSVDLLSLFIVASEADLFYVLCAPDIDVECYGV